MQIIKNFNNKVILKQFNENNYVLVWKELEHDFIYSQKFYDKKDAIKKYTFIKKVCTNSIENFPMIKTALKRTDTKKKPIKDKKVTKKEPLIKDKIVSGLIAQVQHNLKTKYPKLFNNL